MTTAYIYALCETLPLNSIVTVNASDQTKFSHFLLLEWEDQIAISNSHFPFPIDCGTPPGMPHATAALTFQFISAGKV